MRIRVIDHYISGAARVRGGVAVGRCVESDPAVITDDLNTFDYVHEDPIRNPDPLGLGRAGINPEVKIRRLRTHRRKHARAARNDCWKICVNKRTLAIVLSFIGTALSVWIAVFKQAHPSVDLQNLIAIAGPWFLLDIVLLCLPWYRGVSLAAATMLALELLIFWGVFINPKSSTDAVAYVFKPFVQVLVLLPTCLAIGRVIDKRALGDTRG